MYLWIHFDHLNDHPYFKYNKKIQNYSHFLLTSKTYYFSHHHLFLYILCMSHFRFFTLKIYHRNNASKFLDTFIIFASKFLSHLIKRIKSKKKVNLNLSSFLKELKFRKRIKYQMIHNLWLFPYSKSLLSQFRWLKCRELRIHLKTCPLSFLERKICRKFKTALSRKLTRRSCMT